MKKPQERIVAFVFGVVFVLLIMAIALWLPNPTPFQYTVFRIVLALAAAGVAAMLPGFLEVTVKTWIRAGGALAVFVIVYFYSPAGLERAGVVPKTEEQQEIEKPVVMRTPGAHEPTSRFSLIPSAFAADPALPTLRVTRPDQLSGAVAMQRYERIVIENVKAKVPDHATLVANEIEGSGTASLMGGQFGIVARRMANITLDASAAREPGASAGTLRVYVKTIENVNMLANGSAGQTPTQPGPRGLDGRASVAGRDGDCGGFGAYRGATAAQPGGDAGDGLQGLPGGPGSPGGSIYITTIRDPIATTYNVSGGRGATGGPGGPPGTPGAFAAGGRGCTGLGGSQPNQADAPAARSGVTGPTGPTGSDGAPGVREIHLVKNFDSIVAKLKANSNDRLEAALQSP